jgi:hypothetical protein
LRPSPPYPATANVAPALLLDVLTPAGDVHYWSDRRLVGAQCAIGEGGGLPYDNELVDYQPWLMSAGTLKFYRSMQTDTGNASLQNISGDVLFRDFERIASKYVLEGSLYVLRYYSVDMQWAWIEQHGTLSCGEAGATVPLSLVQLFAGQDDTPEQQVSETCQLNWAEKRCGATGDTEYLYTFQSCQVVERFTGIQTAFEINNPEAAAALALVTINRTRAV